MNLGLGNLNDLKRQILPPAMLASTESDAMLQQLGIGVANAFEGACNRRFGRLVNATFTTRGDVPFVVVDRYPLEQIAKIELRETYAEGWHEVTDSIANVDEAAGLIEFNGYLGGSASSLRITFTGGYWFDASEDGTSSMPTGATPLPEAIRTAWLLQTQAYFEALGGLLRDAEKQTPKLNELLPNVREMLQPFRRLA